VVINVIC
jgi:hypothetical protein